jgi:hypothetical protein
MIAQLLSGVAESGSEQATNLMEEYSKLLHSIVEANRKMRPPGFIERDASSSTNPGAPRQPAYKLPLRIPDCDYLNNPLIPEGRYFAVCMMLWTEVEDEGKLPVVLAVFRILPLDGVPEKAKNTVLTATLRSSPRSEGFHDGFLNTFNVPRYYQDAEGKIGEINVKTEQFHDVAYSGVRFHNQDDATRKRADELQKEYDASKPPEVRTLNYCVSYVPHEIAAWVASLPRYDGTPAPRKELVPKVWSTGLPAGKQAGQG